MLILFFLLLLQQYTMAQMIIASPHKQARMMPKIFHPSILYSIKISYGAYTFAASLI